MLRDLDRDEIVTSVGWSRKIRALGMKLLGGAGGGWKGRHMEKKEANRIPQTCSNELRGAGRLSQSLVVEFWMGCRKPSKWGKR